MNFIHVFGSRSLCGESFRDFVGSSTLSSSTSFFSRIKSPGYIYCDLSDPSSYLDHLNSLRVPGHQANVLFINFAPVWIFSDFLVNLLSSSHISSIRISGVISCSSTSIETKKYAPNKFDRKLVSVLHQSESNLQELCASKSVPLCILRLSMIYGSINGFSDKNLSRLSRFFRLFPFCILPSSTGKRQPIHHSQVSETVHYIARNMLTNQVSDLPFTGSYCLGGDETLDYSQMLNRVLVTPGMRFPVLFLNVPDFIYRLVCIPFLLFSPKIFDALQRVHVDLSGFLTPSELTGTPPRSFFSSGMR